MAKKPVSLSFEDIAAYLDSEKKINEFTIDEQNFLMSDVWELEKAEYNITRTLHISKSLTFQGNDSTFTCAGTKECIIISASNVFITGFKINNFPTAILVDSEGKIIENIIVEKVTVNVLGNIGFIATNSQSNGKLRHVHFRECEVYSPTSEWLDVEDELSQQLPFCCVLAMARDEKVSKIENCSIEDIWFENNYSHNGNREPFNFLGSGLIIDNMNDFRKGTPKAYRNLYLDGLHFIGNKVDIAWDAAFNFLGTTFNSQNIHCRNIEIAENDAGTGIAGIYLFVAEPFVGDNSNMTMKHVIIRDNHFHKAIPDVGEPERMVFIGACRLDYYEPTSAYNNLLEDVEIYNNTFVGSGPVVTGIYSMIDGNSVAENNITRNVRIHDNKILRTDTAFIIDGCQSEGRRYDWYWGSPRHDKKWLEPIANNVQTTILKNNAVENITVENNVIEGYRYKLKASGANIRGHAVATGNQACKDIIFSNNNFGIGESHIHVADVIMEDYCIDGGGNTVDLKLKNI